MYDKINVYNDLYVVVAGNTSETGFSMDEFRSGKFQKESFEDSIGLSCARYVGTALAGILSVVAFLSPIAMVVLPKLGNVRIRVVSPCLP